MAGSEDWLDRVQRNWEMVRKVTRQRGPKVYSLLKEASPIAIEGGSPMVVVLAVNHKFHFEKLREPANRELVEWAIQQVLEASLKVRFVRTDEGSGPSALPGRNSASAMRVASSGVAPADIASR